MLASKSNLILPLLLIISINICGSTYLNNCNTDSSGMVWGSFSNDGCVGCGNRQYSSRLWNIPGSWEATCPLTYGRPYSSGPCVLPARCENRGGFNGEWGIFVVPDPSCQYWGWLSYQGCSYPGKQRVSTKLFGIPNGVDWKSCCEAKRNNYISNQWIRKAAYCEVIPTGVWGYFDVADINCASRNTYTSGQCPAVRADDGALSFTAKVVEGFLNNVTTENDEILSQDFENGQNLSTILQNVKQEVEDLEQDQNLTTIAETELLQREKRSLNYAFPRFPINPNIMYNVESRPRIDWQDFNTSSNTNDVSYVCGFFVPPGYCPPPILRTNPDNVGYFDRVNKLIACIRPCNLNQGSVTNQEMRNRARALGEENVWQGSTSTYVSDDAGHIVGNALGGSGTEARNIFPQNLKCNRGQTGGVPGQNRGWRELEDYVRGLVGPPSPDQFPVATVVYELLYTDAAITRPFAVQAEVFFTGADTGFIEGNPSNEEN